MSPPQSPKAVPFFEQAARNADALQRLRHGYIPVYVEALDASLDFDAYVARWELTVMSAEFQDSHADLFNEEAECVSLVLQPLQSSVDYLLNLQQSVIHNILTERARDGGDTCGLESDDFDCDLVGAEAFSPEAYYHALYDYSVFGRDIGNVVYNPQIASLVEMGFHYDVANDTPLVKPASPEKAVPFFEQVVRNNDAFTVLEKCYEEIYNEELKRTLSFEEYYDTVEKHAIAYDMVDAISSRDKANRADEENPDPRVHIMYYPARLKKSADYLVRLHCCMIQRMLNDYAASDIPVPDHLQEADFDTERIKVEPFSKEAYEALGEKELNAVERKYFEKTEIIMEEVFENFFDVQNGRNPMLVNVLPYPQPTN